MKDITKQFHDILESKRNKTFKSEIHSKKKKNKEKPDLSPLLSICIDIVCIFYYHYKIILILIVIYFSSLMH